MSYTTDQTLTALADPTRRQIVALLASRSMSAGALGAACGVSAPALSKHLKVLRNRGVVRAEVDPADNRIRVYQLQPQRLRALQDWLEQLEQQWQAQLQAFKQYVESAPERDRDPSA